MGCLLILFLAKVRDRKKIYIEVVLNFLFMTLLFLIGYKDGQ